MLTSIELCAGAGGQALGLERAGFHHVATVEIDADACATLRHNRPNWNVLHQDVTTFSGAKYGRVDLLAGGLPCPPFSKAGKQLGSLDERNLFPAALRIIEEAKPRAILIENVKGFLDPRFESYRLFIKESLERLGYQVDWRLLNASDFGVPQLRPRVVIVALQKGLMDSFAWPNAKASQPPSVGQVLYPAMASKGWRGALAWREKANSIAPTLVGGSKKHGGPDLGPTRARQAWSQLGVNGGSLAETPPHEEFTGFPRLTVQMAALIQGFPDNWHFVGKKTSAYRQVGNAFPPPVAHAVGAQLHQILAAKSLYKVA